MEHISYKCFYNKNKSLCHQVTHIHEALYKHVILNHRRFLFHHHLLLGNDYCFVKMVSKKYSMGFKYSPKNRSKRLKHFRILIFIIITC